MSGKTKAAADFVAGCKWSVMPDVTLHGFECWRGAKKKLSPKTLNEYLNAASMFFKMDAQDGICCVKSTFRSGTGGHKGTRTKQFRAYTLEEIGKLVKLSGKRGIVYLTAGLTGLRRGELAKLQWCNLEDDGERARIRPHARTAKNRQSVAVPLVAPLREALRERRPSEAGPHDLIFPDGMPDMRTFRNDLAVAGILYEDDQGQDCRTSILCGGRCARCSERAGRLWRRLWQSCAIQHPKLSMKTYMDSSQLATARVVEKLPLLNGDEEKNDAQGDSLECLENGILPDLTPQMVGNLGLRHLYRVAGNREQFTRELRDMIWECWRGQEADEPEEESAPTRIRTWDQGIMSPLL